MNMVNDFTAGERQMFEDLGFQHLHDKGIETIGLYRIAVEDCFVNNRTGLAVDSLRRTYKAIKQCNPYRHTDEFEALIKLT